MCKQQYAQMHCREANGDVEKLEGVDLLEQIIPCDIHPFANVPHYNSDGDHR